MKSDNGNLKLSPSGAKVSQKSTYNHTIKIYTNGHRNSQIFCSISSRILNKNSSITGYLKRITRHDI